MVRAFVHMRRMILDHRELAMRLAQLEKTVGRHDPELRTVFAALRQLLDLYDIGDRQATQLARTYELAQERLRAMEAQRAELDVAIADLRQQMRSSEAMLAGRAPGGVE